MAQKWTLPRLGLTDNKIWRQKISLKTKQNEKLNQSKNTTCKVKYSMHVMVIKKTLL